MDCNGKLIEINSLDQHLKKEAMFKTLIGGTGILAGLAMLSNAQRRKNTKLDAPDKLQQLKNYYLNPTTFDKHSRPGLEATLRPVVGRDKALKYADRTKEALEAYQDMSKGSASDLLGGASKMYDALFKEGSEASSSEKLFGIESSNPIVAAEKYSSNSLSKTIRENKRRQEQEQKQEEKVNKVAQRRFSKAFHILNMKKQAGIGDMLDSFSQGNNLPSYYTEQSTITPEMAALVNLLRKESSVSSIPKEAGLLSKLLVTGAVGGGLVGLANYLRDKQKKKDSQKASGWGLPGAITTGLVIGAGGKHIMNEYPEVGSYVKDKAKPLTDYIKNLWGGEQDLTTEKYRNRKKQIDKQLKKKPLSALPNTPNKTQVGMALPNNNKNSNYGTLL